MTRIFSKQAVELEAVLPAWNGCAVNKLQNLPKEDISMSFFRHNYISMSLLRLN